MAILDALALEPSDDFVVGDAGCARLLGEGHGVRNVVAMCVGKEDVVRFDFIELDFAGFWIASDEGVKQQGLASDLKRETGVTVVPEIHRLSLD